MNKGLTSFRALAFFAIFLFHLNDMGAGGLGVQGGYLGIQAFFVLSGFLLTPILVDMKSNLNKKDFFIHFYGRRALRIFPLYYSYLAIVAFISILAISQHGHFEATSINKNEIIAQLDRFIAQLPWTTTYTYDFYHASNNFNHTYLASHFWSLAVEEQFYLVWPLAIFFLQAKHLKIFLLLVIVVGPLIRLFLGIVLGAPPIVIYVLPFSHIDAFAIGGYFSLYGKNRPDYLVWMSMLFVLILGIITSWLSTRQAHWDQFGYMPYMKDSYKYVWGYSVVNLMFAYILVHVRSRTFMPAFFENSLLVYLGTISYGLYVFHFPVLWLVYATMPRFPETALALISLLVTVMISVVSYEFMEKRFINSKDKYFARTAAKQS